jgi:hypothetical protein
MNKISITNVKISTNWVYDTYDYPINIDAKINGKNVRFCFSGSRSDSIMFCGIDCNEALFEKESGTSYWDKYDRVKISNGGGQTYYALHIYSSVIKSKPKENQKDFRFTGRYYSTQPLKAEFKRVLKELYEKNDLTKEFLEKIA